VQALLEIPPNESLYAEMERELAQRNAMTGTPAVEMVVNPTEVA